jgi:putative membrane protein
MKLSAILSALIGLAVAIALVVLNGGARIGEAIAAAGWGILAVIALHLPQMVFSGQAWRSVVNDARVPSRAAFLGLRLIREGVNALLPVAQIGGEFVGARLLALRGVPLRVAGAAVTVDLTLEMLSQVVFTLLGLGLLLLDPAGMAATHWIVVGIVVALGVAAAFVAAQRLGLFRLLEAGLLRLARAQGWTGLEDVAGLHQAIVALYRSPRRLLLGGGQHFVSWLLGGLEVLVALRVLGVEADLRQALVIESLGQAFRSLGFAVPGALGVQEGGFIVACGLVGIGPDSAVALSLLKRIRELALGVPGLVAWHWVEGRRLGGGVSTAMNTGGEPPILTVGGAPSAGKDIAGEKIS